MERPGGKRPSTLLKSTGATVLAPGPKTLIAPEVKASAPSSPQQEDGGTRSTGAGKPLERPVLAAGAALSSAAHTPRAAATLATGGDRSKNSAAAGLAAGAAEAGAQVSNRVSAVATVAQLLEPSSANFTAAAGADEAAARGVITGMGQSAATAAGSLRGSSSGSRPPSKGRRRDRAGEQTKPADSLLDEDLDALLRGFEEGEVSSVTTSAAAGNNATEKSHAAEEASGTGTSLPDGPVQAAPEKCSSCELVFQAGQSIYESVDSGVKKALCETCWASAAPCCAACGKPVAGALAKVGDSSYHRDCLKCYVCTKLIDGPLSKLDAGLACAACCESVEHDVQELKSLLQQGDATGAAIIADSLIARGITPPAGGESIGKQEQESCSMCQAPFCAGQQIYESLGDNPRSLCEKCWLDAAPVCALCFKAVTGPLARVGDSTYHRECLKCVKCGECISGAFAKTDEGFACVTCHS